MGFRVQVFAFTHHHQGSKGCMLSEEVPGRTFSKTSGISSSKETKWVPSGCSKPIRHPGWIVEGRKKQQPLKKQAGCLSWIQTYCWLPIYPIPIPTLVHFDNWIQYQKNLHSGERIDGTLATPTRWLYVGTNDFPQYGGGFFNEKSILSGWYIFRSRR